MNNRNIFLSVGEPANKEQEDFISKLDEKFKSDGLTTETVGRTVFGSGAPLKLIIDKMDNCCGTIIIGIERTYLSTGFYKRNGDEERVLQNIKYVTPWNQIEAAMAYCKGKPLLIILDEGIHDEGLLGVGFDWYVLKVNPKKDFLNTEKFKQVYNDWKDKVDDYNKRNNLKSDSINKKNDLSEFTIKELLKLIKPSHLWAILAAIAAIASIAFSLGAKII